LTIVKPIISSSYDIFVTTDPLGQIVYLTPERLKHIEKGHIEMIGEEGTIKKTVMEPESIYKDKDFNSTHTYYAKHSNPTLEPKGQYLKVVVDRELQGQVITSYPTIKNRESTEAIYIKE